VTSNDSDRVARARFYILAALRLGGVLLVMAGFAVIAGKWDVGGPDVNRVAGAIMVLVGAFDFAVVPLLLARRWKREGR
jgi:drug/metabolite transporter (DMT)-like permease